MPCSGMHSTHHDRLAGVAQRLQVSEYPVSAASSESRAVLNNDETGSDVGNDPAVFDPESRPRSFEPRTFAGEADILAGESSANNLNASCVPVIPEALARKLSDVSVTGDTRPVFCEHTLAIWVNFAERDGSHSRSFEPEGEAADAAEQIEDIHLPSHVCSLPVSARARSAAAHRANAGVIALPVVKPLMYPPLGIGRMT